MKKKALIALVIFGTFIGSFAANAIPDMRPYSEKRQDVIDEMSKLIREQREKGDYGCCIEPACDMCFMGHWIWDDGVCRCDELIAQGRTDEICPQCKRGIEEGRCRSTQQTCPFTDIMA